MKAHLEQVTKTYFRCPNCGEQSQSSIDLIIAYLEDTSWQAAIARGQYPTFGPWGCYNCGAQIAGKVRSRSDVDLEILPGTDVKVWDVLVLQPQKHPVYFIVDAKDYGRRPGEPHDSNKVYFYDEHTCPTNWIRSVECIAIEADTDPHGLFEFVESLDQDAAVQEPYAGHNPDNETYTVWEKTFPHLIKEAK